MGVPWRGNKHFISLQYKRKIEHFNGKGEIKSKQIKKNNKHQLILKVNKCNMILEYILIIILKLSKFYHKYK